MTHYKLTILIFWTVLFQYSTHLRAQTIEKEVPILQQGIPYFKVYSFREYQASRANWCAVQDKKGRMFFANTAGVLSFDGVKWSLVQSAKKAVVRYLTAHQDGTIFFGSRNDFGYISTDSIGAIKLISLTSLLPSEVGSFRDIWAIQIIEDQIFFQSYNYIFQFRKSDDQEEGFVFEQMVKTKSRIMSFSKIGQELFVYEYASGLYKLAGDKLEMTRQGLFFKDKSVRGVIPYWKSNPNENLLVCTRSDGLFLWNRKENNIQPLEGAYNSFLKKAGFNYAAYLKNGNLAVATEEGLIIVDESRNIVNRSNLETGLPSNDIQFFWEDHQGGLWLTTDNGLIRTEVSNPLKQFGEAFGMNHLIYNITRHKGQLYVGTNVGVFTTPQNEESTFQKIEGLDQEAFSILSLGEDLLVACPYEGIFELQNQRLTKIFGEIPIKLISSRFHSNLILVAAGSSKFGFRFIYKTEKGWKQILTDPIIKEEVRYVVEESDHIIWLGSRGNGFLRLELPDFSASENIDSLKVKVERFPKGNLPAGFRARPYLVGDKVYLASSHGLKRYEPAINDLVQDSSLGITISDTLTRVNHLEADQNGNIWANYIPLGQAARIFRFNPNNQGGFIESEALPIRRSYETSLNTLFPDKEGTDGLWLGTPNGLLWYDASTPSQQMADYHSLITAIWSNGDSLIFGGYDPIAENTNQPPVLAYSDNALRFEFGATSYEGPEETQYQYLLEGFDKNWSNWTKETRKDYTNLPEGSYTFHLKAKNIYDVPGKEATYKFSIKPPWHRSLPAYFAYLIFISLALYLAYRWNTQKLKQRQKRLEQKVEERTQEVNRQKEEIAEQALLLLEKKEQLEVLDQYKQELTGMIVHDLKNPLNTILGLADSFKPGNKIKKITQAGNQMLSLVSNILNVQKFEEAKMELDLEIYDLREIIDLAIDRTSLFKEEKNIQILVKLSPESKIRVDKELIIRVFENLLTNAIKFTPANKSIHIFDTAAEIEGKIKIQVEDEGTGISPEQSDKLFAKYGQIERRKAGRAGSTGLGLTFCKLAVEAHGGSIGVGEKEETGTVIWFTLPATNEEIKVSPKADIAVENLIVENQVINILSSISQEERDWFLPLANSISNYKVFQISKVLEILKEIPSHASPAVQEWQSRIEQSVYTSNQKEFEDLLNEVLKEK